MRTLKFRAYSKKLGMSEPTDFKTLVSTATDFNEFDVYMQFTGLVDRHGVEIYEGDIVRPLKHSNYVVKWYNEENGGVSTYGYYMEVTGMPDVVASINPIQAKNLEVIGNIYEHGHLLEANQ